jgi:hypothetical protein
MVQSPSIVFSYADTLVRNGDTTTGRRMLERLAVGMADTKYGPILLVRMADVMSRGGRGMEAQAIYRTVSSTFPRRGARTWLPSGLPTGDFFRLPRIHTRVFPMSI